MTDREQKALVAQLLAHRDTLAAALAQTDATLVLLGVDEEDPGPGECQHPENQITNRSTFGHPAYHCGGCDQLFDHHPHHAQE